MEIDRDLIKKVAANARLELTEEEYRIADEVYSKLFEIAESRNFDIWED